MTNIEQAEVESDSLAIRRKFLYLWEQTRNAPDYKREEWLEFDEILSSLLKRWNEELPVSALDKIKNKLQSIDLTKIKSGLKKGLNKLAEHNSQ